MAEGGDSGSDQPDHPLYRGRRRGSNRNLTQHDIGNQARILLTGFITDRMEVEGIQNVPGAETFLEPDTPSGPPMENIREVARALRVIGDELDQDSRLQSLISQIPPDAPQQTFMNVAREIFSDGVFNWGRVVALFYFAFKMAMKALDQIPLIRTIINWVVDFIIDYVAKWILERGGWDAIQEYFGTPGFQALGVLLTGVVLSATYVYFKSTK